MLPDYVWRYIYDEPKVLYRVFYRPAKQVVQRWLIPGCTVIIFFRGLRNVMTSTLLYTFTPVSDFLVYDLVHRNVENIAFKVVISR